MNYHNVKVTHREKGHNRSVMIQKLFVVEPVVAGQATAVAPLIGQKRREIRGRERESDTVINIDDKSRRLMEASSAWTPAVRL
ncbi:uncharacterized [Tachysurus ichikawai]